MEGMIVTLNGSQIIQMANPDGYTLELFKEFIELMEQEGVPAAGFKNYVLELKKRRASCQCGNINGDPGPLIENKGHHGKERPDSARIRRNGMRIHTRGIQNEVT